MPISFSIADVDADARISVEFSRRPSDGAALVRVLTKAVAASGAELVAADVDTVDACVADATLSAGERTTLMTLVRRIALRGRARLGVAP